MSAATSAAPVTAGASKPSPSAGPPPSDFGPPAPRRRGRRIAALTIVVLIGAAAGSYGVWWYIWSRTHESTDDAQVEGDIIPMAAQVSGYVVEVAVRDNQLVEPGQLLVRIRDEDLVARVNAAQAQLNQAESELAAAQHNLDALRGTTAANLAQAEAGVHQAEAQYQAVQAGIANVAARVSAAEASAAGAAADTQAAQAALARAEFELHRVQGLVSQNTAATDELNRVQTDYDGAQARLAAARFAQRAAEASTDSARSLLEAVKAGAVVVQAMIAGQTARVEEARTGPQQVRASESRVQTSHSSVAAAHAQLELARIQLGYTVIRAPQRGVVSRRSVEPGQLLQIGVPMLAIVPLDSTWVVANFKETQLRDMRVGQPTSLAVDAYPGHRFEGRIDSIAAGTGARFSLLPPENATGNYVKVVQRVPVKIVVDARARDPERPLRPGLNVVATVDTGVHPPPTLYEAAPPAPPMIAAPVAGSGGTPPASQPGALPTNGSGTMGSKP
jgi:membrane fusion protein, multidrug efflux system